MGTLKAIPGYEGFYACTDGKVWSTWEQTRGGVHGSGSQITPRIHEVPNHAGKDGYRLVHIKSDRKELSRSVHGLVALAFIGPRPAGAHVDHVDFDKTNNRPENLQYLSAATNSGRISAEGQARRNAVVGLANTRFADGPVVAAILEYLKGERGAESVAESVGISSKQLLDIARGINRPAIRTALLAVRPDLDDALNAATKAAMFRARSSVGKQQAGRFRPGGGVAYSKKDNRWVAYASENGKRVGLGQYRTEAEARAVRQRWEDSR